MLAPLPAFACGTDTACKVGNREYRIAMPPNAEGPVGAIIWAHGYRGSSEGVMRFKRFIEMAHGEGLALIAAHGVNGTWDLPNGPRDMTSTGAAEFAYFEDVIEDATTRFDIDQARIVAAGFSAGGMVVWNLACARPDLFAGFVPIAGTYWLEPPATCAAPVASIVHIHGTADKTVPLTGRAIGPTKQGEVMQSLENYAAFGAFGTAETAKADGLRCQRQRGAGGALLEYCLWDGGHSFRLPHLRYGIERLKAVGKL